MRNLFYLMFILSLILVADNSSAAISPALIKIRMQKDLSEFPFVDGAITKKISENVWSLRGSQISIGKKQLPYNNFIVKKQNGNFDVISVLEFNEYLTGVVAHEMPLSWPFEALKAQAVVARSYALARIQERQEKNFHLEADQMDQVFSGSDSEKAKAAVEATEGYTLFDTQGTVVKAYFHSDCGGETVSATDVWGGRGFNSGTAKDPWCASRKSNKWSFEISRDEFQNRLLIPIFENQNSSYRNKSQLLSFGEFTITVQKLRQVFGFFKIRSAADQIVVTDEKVHIYGSGFGHGVGLCQYGTLEQAKQGLGFKQIIQHYYPKARLLKDIQSLAWR